ncbi:MAG: (E)-4-hydroxy-3-methylbut-2-enyl-diphosphate synthase [Parachlamydiaceae bacterium]
MIKYCDSVFTTKRWRTREIFVGNVGLGGNYPIRIQSMTTSSTRDIDATMEQVLRLEQAGCDIVRITVQGMKEAESFELIKNGLLQRRCTIPLVADIHFFPPAAMRVIESADKVRINPGNFADKRASFKVIDYDDYTYALELEKIEEKFTPLVEKSKRLKKVLRIGVNHGSLSDRIMNRFGDSPRGMLESALEFARICRKNDFHDFVFSMKSSNPQVMIHAYRLLVAEMMQLGWNYPLHLGVTEAGEGEDGRIKSAMGIGALLLDGLGDTIRVSLTEDAWNEIDPCKRLIALAKSYSSRGTTPFEEKHRDCTAIQRRVVELPKHLSMHRDGSVLLTIGSDELKNDQVYQKLGCGVQLGSPKLKVNSVDLICLKENIEEPALIKVLDSLKEIGVSILSKNPKDERGVIPLREAIVCLKNRFSLEFFSSSIERMPKAIIVSDETPQEWEHIKNIHPCLVILSPKEEERLHYSRHFFDWMKDNQLAIPVILNFRYTCPSEDLVIHASAECGTLLCDGLGEGLWLEGPYDVDFLRNVSFNLLQAARMRIFKTDFISCPSCGRTLFDLQDVSKRIRSRTAHLPGVKIAIMGCIVNGPGEMADADFGYVGSKPGMIDLYVGKKCVEKDISFAEADDRLIDLIKKHDRWIEPKAK